MVDPSRWLIESEIIDLSWVLIAVVTENTLKQKQSESGMYALISF